MLQEGTLVVLDGHPEPFFDGETGRIEVVSEDDNGYLIRLSTGVVLEAPASAVTPLTEDAEVFGAKAWVYCRQHMRAHQTGWCTVSVRDKVGLGVTDAKAAYAKCRDWGLELYSDKYQLGDR